MDVHKEGSVLLITNIPTPYRIPLFNRLSELMSLRGIRLVVYFAAMREERRKWSIDIEEVNFEYFSASGAGTNIFGSEGKSFLYSGLSHMMRSVKPQLIVTDGFAVSTLKVWMHSFFNNTPYIIWSGAVNDEDKIFARLRRLQRKILLRSAFGCIVYGTKSQMYLIGLGYPKERISIAINTVDTSFFMEESMEYETNAKTGGRKADVPRFVCVSELTRRKSVHLLLESVLELTRERKDFVVDIVGDGPERKMLEEFVLDKKIDRQVVFHGYKQRSDVRNILSNSICFLMPTSFDIWGLVLIEAMSMGLFVLASKNAGASSDLVVENETGFVLDFSNFDSVVEKMEWILDNQDKAQKMGEQAKKLISEKASIDTSASQFTQALLNAL